MEVGRQDRTIDTVEETLLPHSLKNVYYYVTNIMKHLPIQTCNSNQ
jgi:hypothetical protein